MRNLDSVAFGSEPCNCLAFASAGDPSRPILSQSPCSSRMYLLWFRCDEGTYGRRLQRLWAILETPHASNIDMFAQAMRLVSTWEASGFYLPQSAVRPGIFDAADSVPPSTVSSRLPGSGAYGRAAESISGSGAASSRPPVDLQQRIGQWVDGTSARGHLAIMRDHGWGSSRGAKRTRRSSDDEA